jgi:hypothetical protein
MIYDEKKRPRESIGGLERNKFSPTGGILPFRRIPYLLVSPQVENEGHHTEPEHHNTEPGAGRRQVRRPQTEIHHGSETVESILQQTLP